MTLTEVTNSQLENLIHCLLSQKQVMTVDEKPLPKEEPSFQGEMVHLGPKFIDGMSMPITAEIIPTLIENGVLQKKVSNVFKTTKKFEFNIHGFEFLNFSNALLGKAIEKLATGPTAWEKIPEETINEHATAVEDALATWGKGVGISFSKVVWIDTVYRNTAGGKFGAVHFCHVDFPDNEYKATLKGHSSWKERVAKKLGPLTTEQYEKLDISRMVNIWMPLDEQLEAEPLAMMDVRTIGEKNCRVYQDERLNGGDKYPSVGICPSIEQRWYIKDGMKRSDAIVFDSCKTPHSAVSLPDQGTKTRRSVECRVLFIK